MADSDRTGSASDRESSAPDTALDPSDPFAREAQTFPHLSAEMMARVARYGSEERFAARAPIYSRGDRNVDFFVVVEGSIEILDIDEHDLPQVFLALRARQFAGELNLFNEREVLVSARAGEPAAARPPRRFPPPRLDRSRHRRDRHARVHRAPRRPGGQAGTSSKIENYRGFPTGISGQALAGRVQVQAQKFGARLALSRAVAGLDCDAGPYTLKLEDGESDRGLPGRVAAAADDDLVVGAEGCRRRRLKRITP